MFLCLLSDLPLSSEALAQKGVDLNENRCLNQEKLSSSFNMFFKKLLYYLNPLNLFKKDEDADINLRMMHGINKISILVFVICLIVMAIKFFT